MPPLKKPRFGELYRLLKYVLFHGGPLLRARANISIAVRYLPNWTPKLYFPVNLKANSIMALSWAPAAHSTLDVLDFRPPECPHFSVGGRGCVPQSRTWTPISCFHFHSQQMQVRQTYAFPAGYFFVQTWNAFEWENFRWLAWAGFVV